MTRSLEPLSSTKLAVAMSTCFQKIRFIIQSQLFHLCQNEILIVLMADVLACLLLNLSRLSSHCFQNKPDVKSVLQKPILNDVTVFNLMTICLWTDG